MPCAAETTPRCPLCLAAGSTFFVRVRDPDAERRYFLCPTCSLVFLDPAQRLDAAAERAHYGLHRNHPEDQGYRHFLGRLSTPLTARLPIGARGLDYGCGPGPTLSRMLREQGFHCSDHDPLFQPNPDALQQRHDFITCTEVIEHVHDPATTWPALRAGLRPGGILAVMTSWLVPRDDFPRWHYRRDPTHVCFYSPSSLSWVAARLDCRLELPADNVAFFIAPDHRQT